MKIRDHPLAPLALPVVVVGLVVAAAFFSREGSEIRDESGEPVGVFYESSFSSEFADLYADAISFVKRRRFEDALEVYLRLDALEPALPHALMGAANCLVFLGRPEEAKDAYRRATERDPSFAYAFEGLGDVSLSTGDVDGAISAYGRAVQILPRLSRSHAGLAVALRAAGRLDEAADAARDALRLGPPDEDAARLREIARGRGD